MGMSFKLILSSEKVLVWLNHVSSKILHKVRNQIKFKFVYMFLFVCLFIFVFVCFWEVVGGSVFFFLF